MVLVKIGKVWYGFGKIWFFEVMVRFGMVW